MRDNYERDEGFFNRKWLEITACTAGLLPIVHAMFPIGILGMLQYPALCLWLVYAFGFFYTRKRYIVAAVFAVLFIGWHLLILYSHLKGM